MDASLFSMSNFERLKYYYVHNWVTKDQLKQYVALGTITPEQYKLITGDEYVA